MNKDIIKKWVLFNYNYQLFGYTYKCNFIRKCWNDENDMFQDHLLQKFTECHNNMNKFFTELDSENQNKLVNWIFENYKG